MTIDEAIADNLRIAEGQDKCAEISASEHAKERIKVCAAEHRQLAAWLTELKEAKRLLKAVVEFRKSGYCTKNCSECVASPCDYIDWFKNMYENEIEKLIGEDGE